MTSSIRRRASLSTKEHISVIDIRRVTGQKKTPLKQKTLCERGETPGEESTRTANLQARPFYSTCRGSWP